MIGHNTVRTVTRVSILVAAVLAAAGLVFGFKATADGWIDFSGSIIGGMFTVLAGWLIWKAARHQSEISLQELVATDEFHFRSDQYTANDFITRTEEAAAHVAHALEDLRRNLDADARAALAMEVEQALLPVVCVENRYIRYVFSYELERLAWLSGAIRDKVASVPDHAGAPEVQRLLTECARLLTGTREKLARIAPKPPAPQFSYAR